LVPKSSGVSKGKKRKPPKVDEAEASEAPEEASKGGEPPQKRVWQPYASRIRSDPSSREYMNYKRNRIKQDKLLLLMQNV
jgi:hypothetical protein